MNKSKFILLFLSIIAFCSGFYKFTGNYLLLMEKPHKELPDFTYYTTALNRFAVGPENLYEFYPDLPRAKGFIYPPVCVLVFLPFSKLNVHYAYLMFGTINYLLFIFSILFFLNCIEIFYKQKILNSMKIIIILCLLGTVPLYQNIMLGQFSVIVLFFNILFLWFFLKKRISVASIFLSLSIWIKLYPLLFLFIFIRHPSWKKMIRICVLILLGIPFIFSFIVPIKLYIYYFEKILPGLFNHIQINNLNQSLIVTVLRMFYVPDSGLKWEQIIIPEMIKWFFTFFSLLLLLILFTVFYRKKFDDLLMRFSFVMALIPVISPLGWGHLFVLSFPIIVFAFFHFLHSNKPLEKIFLFFLIFLFYLKIPYAFMVSYLDIIPYFIKNLIYSNLLFSTLGLICFMVCKCKNSNQFPSLSVAREHDDSRHQGKK